MEIINMFPGSWGSNCYIIVGKNRHAFVVDPSASATAIVERMARDGITLDGILLTHGHFDHIISLDNLRDMAHIPAMIHYSDNELLGDGRKNAFYNFFGMDRAYREAEILLHDGDVIPLGEEKIKVIGTPGHTEGSVCFLADKFIVTGDTLFSDSYGRCDLYSGNLEKLMTSLDALKSLDPSLRIYPGHGESALLGQSLANIYFQ